MSKNELKSIYIFTDSYDSMSRERIGSGDSLQSPELKTSFQELEIDPKRIAIQIRGLVEALDDEFQNIDSNCLEMQNLEVSLSVNGKGKVGILGTGMEASANASIKLVLKTK